MNDAVTSVVAGPRVSEHLEDCVKVDDATLDGEAMQAVDEIVPPPKCRGERW